jgi:hypothetical protein
LNGMLEVFFALVVDQCCRNAVFILIPRTTGTAF